MINQGANPNANHDSYNVCYLSIPKPGPEIQSVKILVKEGVNGSFLFVDEGERSALFKRLDEESSALDMAYFKTAEHFLEIFSIVSNKYKTAD